jgi:hypothetical protein
MLAHAMAEADGYQDLVRTFASAGLELPPIPEVLRPRLRRLDDWVWATRPIVPLEMYLFGEYIEELFREPVADYVAVSHAGQGINSYGLNVHLVHGPLALFTQDGWGGVYMDRTNAARTIAETFRRSRELVEVVDSSSRIGTRVVVMWSEFRGNCAHTQVLEPSAAGKVGWECRGPFSGMGWFPISQADGAPIVWSHHDDREALFRSALAELTSRDRRDT